MKKIAIVTLVKTTGKPWGAFPDMLIERNQYLERYFLPKLSKYECDKIIFHEGDISESMQSYISEHSGGSPIIFANLKEWEPKTGFDDRKNIVNMELCPPPLPLRFEIGYLHMCHFWSVDFIHYLKDYDYVIRVDEDCNILEADSEELEHIIDNGIPLSCVATTSVLLDTECTQGLERFLNGFCQRNDIPEVEDFSQVPEPYTNFMIVNASYYRQNKLVEKFHNEVEETNCMYSNRWADHIMWGIISHVLDKGTFYRTKSISYHHKSHRVTVNGLTNEKYGYSPQNWQ